MRRRIRANIEIDGVSAFWEDHLFPKSNPVSSLHDNISVTTTANTVDFYIGNTLFTGINPCLRCVVPTKDPDTGESYPHFQKIFAQQRQKTLPIWAEPSQFQGFYRLAVNTRLHPSESAKNITIGAEIQLYNQLPTNT
jgi:uncharacterized protein YcbX